MVTDQPVLRFEVCVDSVVGAAVAEEAGADRVELCQALSVGGLTPSAGAIRQTRSAIDLRLHVLIRPRAGEFRYDDAEMQVMLRDIEQAGAEGADGVVIGMLRADGLVDEDGIARLTDGARPMSVTFHRAFDVTADPAVALGQLQALGVDRVLTSGQASSAYDGRELLGRLVQLAGGGLTVMAGGGVRVDNAADIVRETGVGELHFSASRRIDAGRSAGVVTMGDQSAADRERRVTDGEAVRTIMERCRQVAR